jgi:hypothetical protein
MHSVRDEPGDMQARHDSVFGLYIPYNYNGDLSDAV